MRPGVRTSEYALVLVAILCIFLLAWGDKASTDVVLGISGLGGLYASHRFRLKDRADD